MIPIKLVLDTNIYIQSLMRPGSFLDVLIKRLVNGMLVELYTSREILLELRSKAETRFELSDEESLRLVQLCEALCTLAEPSRHISVVTRDPDDNKIIACALEAQAVAIITADKDLLDLKEYETIKIIHPSMLKFWFPDNL